MEYSEGLADSTSDCRYYCGREAYEEVGLIGTVIGDDRWIIPL